MSEPRVSDLHLKKELTQIRKAARALRDPGTSSTWRSPLASSRSAAVLTPGSDAAAAAARPANHDKRVFLYNWKNPRSEENEDERESSSSFAGGGSSLEGSLSDARFDGGGERERRRPSAAAAAARRRDTGLAPSPALKRSSGVNKRGKKMMNYRLDVLSGCKNEMVLSRRLNSLGLGLGLGRDDSVDQSDGTNTEDYCNSEDTRRVSGASPLLLKVNNSNRHRRNWARSRRGDSSYTYSTPALSTSSLNRCCGNDCSRSTAGSWDGTTASMNNGDDEADDRFDFPGRQGCGIPCYWSKRTGKHRSVCGGCYSPSFSDTLRRKGSSILCGSQTIYPGRRQVPFSSSKRRASLRSAQGVLPLLSMNGDVMGGSSVGTGRSDDDELSTNFAELDLEGLSRLDGRRWSSSCRSHDGLEIVALNRERDEEEETPENVRSFGHKYRPMFFGELIGQGIVVQSLVSAVSRGRIAPVYLFQGPRGTGKTSAARIFASALNCLASDESKPCGYCRECMEIVSGKSKNLWEVDGTDKRGIDRVRHVMKSMLSGPSTSSRYRVLVIDECHLLSSKTWLAFLKFLEDAPQRFVFIFITTDLDNVPRTVQSRCQRYLFNKIKDCDIVARLRKISAEENLDVDPDALDLIALNADGSLRDAETMLEQLSLLGKRISKSLVNELVGVVSDDKLFELLEVAMSSDTAETVKRARELMDSGVDPIVLMSQLASLIMDIIAGTYNTVDGGKDDSLFGGRNATEAELERLKHALKLLSEAERQLRISSERSTWFTATLLQLGSVSSPDPNHSGSSRRQSYKTTDDAPSIASIEAAVYKQNSGIHYLPHKSSSPGKKILNGSTNSARDLSSRNDGLVINSKYLHIDGGVSAASCDDDVTVGNVGIQCVNSEKLDSIWARCIEKCHSKTLRQLLHTHGRLVSISDVEGVLIAYVVFSDENIKTRAERFLSSITNSIEMVLKCNIEVRIILLPGGEVAPNATTPIGVNGERKPACLTPVAGYSKSHSLPDGNYHSSSGSSGLLSEGNVKASDKEERRQEIPMQRIESIIREQRLETAWLQAAEKGTPGSLSHLKPEKNQVLPQEVSEDQTDLMNSNGFSSRQWEDELNHELKVLKADNGKVHQKDQIGSRMDRYPMSPSLLHDANFMGTFAKDNPGYESGSSKRGCSVFLCWNRGNSHSKGKVRGTSIRPHKGGRFSLFGECGKAKKTDSRLRR